jgi:hypothetical protein
VTWDELVDDATAAGRVMRQWMLVPTTHDDRRRELVERAI